MRRWREEDYWPTFGGENFGGEGGPVDWLHPGEAGPHVGRGPRKYKRPDDRILEDVNERLTLHPMIDATDVEVTVQNGEVTLAGSIETNLMKRLAEDEVDCVWGVVDVHNQLRVKSTRHAA
jgi:osmotically-inducible protein OsmY